MTKSSGKPYAGKPHVRIDEGAGRLAFPLYSTVFICANLREIFHVFISENLRDIQPELPGH
jgi:hypothetical protein